jgi:hypothetical protein
MLCDPPKWWTEIEQWAHLYGEEVVVGFDTNSPRRFGPACGRFATAVREGSITHDGKEGLIANLAACAKRKVRLADSDEDGRTQFVIVKADTRKIDRAVGAILALEAALTMPVRRVPQIISMNDIVRDLRARGELP